MRSNLILSILLTTVIASPVVRRSQNANGLIEVSADVAGNNGKGESELALPLVGDDGKGESELALPLVGDKDLELKRQIADEIDIFKKVKGIKNKIDIDRVLRMVKHKIELENLSSVKKGDILAILEEYVGIDAKLPVLDGEEIELGRDTPEAKAKAKTEAEA